MAKKKRQTKDWLKACADTFCDALQKSIDSGDPAPPWRTPWKGSRRVVNGAFLGDHNPMSGTVYRGGNVLFLAMSRYAQGFSSLEWGSFKQWKKAGGAVRKGSEGTAIVFWKPVPRPELDEDGNPVLKADGTPSMKKSFILKGHTVFNRDQVEGLPEVVKPELEPEELEAQEALTHELADQILKESGASISWDSPGRAFYRPTFDTVHLPPREDFEEAPSLYGVAFHELTHWTGHSSRVLKVHPKCTASSHKRLEGHFGSPEYGREELVAELGAMMLCSVTGINQPLEIRDNHLAYLRNWMEAVRNDPMVLMSAASRAKDASTYLLDKAGIEIPTLEASQPHQETQKAA